MLIEQIVKKEQFPTSMGEKNSPKEMYSTIRHNLTSSLP